jgi:hypothetical protein
MPTPQDIREYGAKIKDILSSNGYKTSDIYRPTKERTLVYYENSNPDKPQSPYKILVSFEDVPYHHNNVAVVYKLLDADPVPKETGVYLVTLDWARSCWSALVELGFEKW